MNSEPGSDGTLDARGLEIRGLDARGLVDHLFRRKAGQMVASLTRILGPGRIDLAEDVVQEALLSALRRWPFHGVPDDPGAWLARVARNRAIDALRRDAAFRRIEPELRHWAARTSGAADEPAELADDQLAILFAACDPRLAAPARVAVTLKIIGGFGVGEIARATLESRAAVAQRLVRAKRHIRALASPLAIPSGQALEERLAPAIEVLYLMFNEGYSAHAGDRLVREDVLAEALRLSALLARDPRTDQPDVHALHALMCFHAARAGARTAGGALVVLEEQDRSAWDQGLIARGVHLDLARQADGLGRYHLEAGIAACHACGTPDGDTDWGTIRHFYALLEESRPSPVVALNHAIAVAMSGDPGAGLARLASLRSEPRLGQYHLLPASEGVFLMRCGRHADAAARFEAALAMECTAPERRLLERRLAEARAVTGA